MYQGKQVLIIQPEPLSCVPSNKSFFLKKKKNHTPRAFSFQILTSPESCSFLPSSPQIYCSFLSDGPCPNTPFPLAAPHPLAPFPSPPLPSRASSKPLACTGPHFLQAGHLGLQAILSLASKASKNVS